VGKLILRKKRQRLKRGGKERNKGPLIKNGTNSEKREGEKELHHKKREIERS